jgi:hypothetical protein
MDEGDAGESCDRVSPHPHIAPAHTTTKAKRSDSFSAMNLPPARNADTSLNCEKWRQFREKAD